MVRIGKSFVKRLLTKSVNYLYKKVSFESQLIDEVNMFSEFTSPLNYVPTEIKQNKISSAAWFIPGYAFDRVYGGAYVVARFVHDMIAKGVDTYIVLYSGSKREAISAKKYFEREFDVAPNILLFGKDNLPTVDAAFAMNWESAYIVNNYNKASRHIYFVLEYDPGFYAASAVGRLAHESYRLPMEFVVYGIGLAEYIKREFGIKCHVMPITVDKSLFYPTGRLEDKPFKVFFYARPHRVRNGFTLGVSALKLAKKLIPDLEVYSAGEDLNLKTFGLSSEWWHNLGYLHYKSTPQVYRSCHVSLVFCFTRATSIVALETMACGSLLITNQSEFDFWLTNGDTTALSLPPFPISIANKLHEIQRNLSLYSQIAQRGQILASTWEWRREADRVLSELGI